jgi:hypothetical protein
MDGCATKTIEYTALKNMSRLLLVSANQLKILMRSLSRLRASRINSRIKKSKCNSAVKYGIPQNGHPQCTCQSLRCQYKPKQTDGELVGENHPQIIHLILFTKPANATLKTQDGRKRKAVTPIKPLRCEPSCRHHWAGGRRHQQRRPRRRARLGCA